MAYNFRAQVMSACGTKQTCSMHPRMSASGGKADIPNSLANVRSSPKADIEAIAGGIGVPTVLQIFRLS